MYREQTVYACTCAKCHGKWVTKTHDLPQRCAKCNAKGWNADHVVKSLFPIPEPQEANPQSEPVTIAPASTLDALRGLVDAVNAKHEITEDWRFEKGVQYADDGSVYRSQLLAPAFKRRRTVEVEIENHENIIRVC